MLRRQTTRQSPRPGPCRRDSQLMHRRLHAVTIATGVHMAADADARAAVRLRPGRPGGFSAACGATRSAGSAGVVADQAMSSLTNFAVNIYIARTLGAVQYGAFSLAYVTYGFMLNASRGLATDPLWSGSAARTSPTWRRAVADAPAPPRSSAWSPGPACWRRPRCSAARPGTAFLRSGADAARTDAAGQLAVFVLRARAGQPGLPQRHDLGGGAAARSGAADGRPATRTCSGSSSPGALRRRSPPPSGHCRRR